ncbi:MAG: four helix bundle protein [Taibaiella sp.]|nr:four helix bundle protein [Taibaiella sp.]
MQTELKNKNIVLQLSFELAIDVIQYCALLDELKKWSLSNQMMRAALSIGANIKEAQNAESKNDFIHKMKIAAKEADELEYYFEICNAVTGLPTINDLLLKTQTVCKILNKIIGTSKANQITS